MTRGASVEETLSLMAGVRANARTPKKDYRTIKKPDLMVSSGNQTPYRQIDTETIPFDYILYWSRFRRTDQSTAYACSLKKQL